MSIRYSYAQVTFTMMKCTDRHMQWDVKLLSVILRPTKNKTRLYALCIKRYVWYAQHMICLIYTICYILYYIVSPLILLHITVLQCAAKGKISIMYYCYATIPFSYFYIQASYRCGSTAKLSWTSVCVCACIL